MTTTIKNNKEEIPFEHYLDEFKTIDPEERAKVLGLEYVDETFQVTMYGDEYRIKWPEGTLTCENPEAIAMVKMSGHILLLRYIIYGKQIPTSGNFKTFRQLPWGEIYQTPFSGRCIARLAYTFNGRKEKFIQAATALGGRPLNHGDAGFAFDFTGDYHLNIYLWESDEEFPPNSQIEFSDNFALGFSAEDSVVTAELLIGAISNKMKKI